MNSFFDAVGEPIGKHGGEILKFIGDGLLAIFPMDRKEACMDLIAAVREGYQAASRLWLQDDHVRFGLGIHLGAVNCGNIGSRHRLDFTVIGSAINRASSSRHSPNACAVPHFSHKSSWTQQGAMRKPNASGLIRWTASQPRSRCMPCALKVRAAA
ncbi:adenylate/guanylate cyclase domain-containing protein [Ensifer sp. ENS12]|nr:adenylate/guanylate cyclase domain-containing protein [Ensifer sp. ENS12]